MGYDKFIELNTPIEELEEDMWERLERQAGCYSYDEKAICYGYDEED